MKITFGQGLNADALPSEQADGFASDCGNVRFRDGFAERIGGWTTGVATFTGNPSWLGAAFTTASTFVVGVGLTTRVAHAYTLGGSSTPDEITRYTEGKEVSSATAVGATVTITTVTNHGLNTGDIISVWGFSNQYNAESVAITKLTNNTFSYVVSVAPGVSPASRIGLYSADAARSNFTASAYRPTGGDFNNVFVMNTPGDGFYYWGGSASIPFRKIPTSYAARVGRPFGNYLVQLAPIIGGVEFPFLIAWSNAAEAGALPSTFVTSATNQAGDLPRPDIGEFVDGVPLGDDFIIYGKRGRISMSYSGGTEVFTFRKLLGNDGLYASDCVVSTPVGHVFVNQSKQVKVHSGGDCQDISSGRVSNILGQQDATIGFVVAHPKQNEVWIGYAPTSSVSYPTKVLIWNWKENTWGKADLSISGTTRFALGVANKLYFINNNSLNEADVVTSATSVGGSTYDSFVERAGMDMGDTETMKNLQRSRPRFDWDATAHAGTTVTVSHGSSMYSDGSPTYATGVPYTIGTSDYANARATGGRFCAFKALWTVPSGYADPPAYGVRLRTVDLDATGGGKR